MKSPRCRKQQREDSLVGDLSKNMTQLRKQIPPLFGCVVRDDMSAVKCKDDERPS